MKRFACLLLMAVLLLSGCQAASQQEPMPTEPIEYEHYFFKELCYCTLGPEKPFREQPNYLQYTKEIWEKLEELLDTSKTVNGVEYEYYRSIVHEMPENANHPARKEVIWDKYGWGDVEYFHGTDVMWSYDVSYKKQEGDKEKSQDELKVIAEAFMKEAVPEEILREYTEVSFELVEDEYRLKYVREFPETQSKDYITTKVNAYGAVTSFSGPAIHRYDRFMGKIVITEDMKNAAYQAAMEILEKCELQNAEILEVSYGYGPLGIMYLNLEVEYDAIDDFGNIVRHKDLFHVNVN